MRHALFQGVTSDNESYLTGLVGKIESRLPRRVSGTDEVDIESIGGTHFAACGSIVDALTDKPIEAIDGGAAPRNTGG